MNSCNYHQFDDGQGLNGNIGPDTYSSTDNIEYRTPPAASLPDGWKVDEGTGDITDANGNVAYMAIDSNAHLVGNKKNDASIDYDGGPEGKTDKTKNRKNETSLGASYDYREPGIALNQKQVAAIKKSDPAFKLGDKVGVLYNGRFQQAVYFDNASTDAKQANNYWGHIELNPTAFRAFGVSTKIVNSITTTGPMSIVALKR